MPEPRRQRSAIWKRSAHPGHMPMVELLAAGLTGSHFAAGASSFLDAKGPPPATGQLIIAFDPQAVGGPQVLGRFAALAEAA